MSLLSQILSLNITANLLTYSTVICGFSSSINSHSPHFTISVAREKKIIYYYILLFQALTKELEAKTGLKTAVITAGTQLVQLREPGGDLDREPEDSDALLSQMSDSDLCSVQSQLRDIELGWSSLLLDVPVVRQELHQVTFLASSLKYSQLFPVSHNQFPYKLERLAWML